MDAARPSRVGCQGVPTIVSIDMEGARRRRREWLGAPFGVLLVLGHAIATLGEGIMRAGHRVTRAGYWLRER